MDNVDVNNLSRVDRLGIAYCRLNSWEWDEYIGPKPESFDELPRTDLFYLDRKLYPWKMKLLAWINPDKYKAPERTKHQYIHPVMKAIKAEIGIANVSRCHWMYVLGKTEEEWRKWFYTEYFS